VGHLALKKTGQIAMKVTPMAPDDNRHIWLVLAAAVVFIGLVVLWMV